MSQPTPDPTEFVNQMAALINLPLQPEHHPGVVANMERIMAIAQLVMEFPLPDTIEPAPKFEP